MVILNVHVSGQILQIAHNTLLTQKLVIEVSNTKNYCIHSHLKQRAQEVARAGGAGDAGAVEWDEGWRRAGPGLRGDSSLVEQKGWNVKSWGTDQVSQLLRPLRWPGQPPE